MKRIYIAGKISGEKEEDYALKFNKAQKSIEKHGYFAVNPVSLVQNHLLIYYPFSKLTSKEIWTIAMQVCIKELVDCDCILLLDDWQESKGAMIEQKLAQDLGIRTILCPEKIENLKLQPL